MSDTTFVEYRNPAAPPAQQAGERHQDGLLLRVMLSPHTSHMPRKRSTLRVQLEQLLIGWPPRPLQRTRPPPDLSTNPTPATGHSLSAPLGGLAVASDALLAPWITISGSLVNGESSVGRK